LAQGHGVEQNLVEAYKWVSLAKAGSAFDRAAAIETQGRLISIMTVDQIEAGQALATEFVVTFKP
jgi:hypothetical protein